MNRFCSNCGETLGEDALYCSNCGYKNIDDQNNQLKNISIPKTNKIKSFKFLFLLIPIIIIIAIVMWGLNKSTPGNDTKSVIKQLSLGEQYLSDMDFEQAVIAFNKINQNDAKNVQAYIGLAKAYIGLEKSEDAIQALEKGIVQVKNEKEYNGTILVGSEDLYINLSEIYKNTGNPSKAYDVLNQGFALIDSERLHKLLEDYIPKVQVSVPSGNYDAPQTVTISNSNAKYIYYTLDGSEPTKESSIYNEPIILEDGTVALKILAVSDLGVMGDIQDFKYNITSNSSVENITFTVEASSIFHEPVKGETYIYNPLYISDKDTTTSWVEASKGDGANEWISFNSDDKFDLDSLQIINGFTKSERTYRNNCRVAEMKLISSEGDEKTFALQDNTLTFQKLEVGFKNIRSIKIMITKVYKGAKYKDLCISELKFNESPLNLILSDSNKQIIQNIKSMIANQAKNDDLIGYYDIDRDNGGFYNKNFKLIEKFNYFDYPVQYARNFALCKGGIVTDNGGDEDTVVGTWKVEDNNVIIKYDYTPKLDIYFIHKGMLFRKFNKDDWEMYTFHTNNITYEGYIKH